MTPLIRRRKLHIADGDSWAVTSLGKHSPLHPTRILHMQINLIGRAANIIIPHTMVSTAVVALGCIMIFYIARRALRYQHHHPLPPGPPGLPWIGNVIGINTSAPWVTYAEWARTYGRLQNASNSSSSNEADIYAGNVIYFQMLGKDVIIINSEKIAKELLEHRSRNYSDRPYLLINEMSGPSSFSCC